VRKGGIHITTAAMFTELIDTPPATASAPKDAVPARDRFLQLLAEALDDASLVKLSLAAYAGTQPEAGLTLQRLLVRPIVLRGAATLQFVWRYDTRDTTKNHAPLEGLQQIADLLGDHGFETAHMEWRNTATTLQQAEFRHKLKGGRDKSKLIVSKVGAPAGTDKATAKPAGADRPNTKPARNTAPTELSDMAGDDTEPVVEPFAEVVALDQPDTAHNRTKHRELSLDLPCWIDLGLATVGTDHHAVLVPAMARKWKQINRFIEVIGAAVNRSSLADQPHVSVLDFGSGKGYLTFAVHAWLTAQGKQADVTGVELRTGLVDLCMASARRHELDGLHFSAGDVRSYEPAPVDVMIALHACDTATDHAIHLGLRAGAQLIVCSPCCHKQLRPQMTSPPLLRPMLQHGIHLGQQAEMVTDSLRALLLDAAGYDTQVFEFISLEHTSKNKMILAVKRLYDQPGHAEAVMKQVDEIKAFYGVKDVCLQALMQSEKQSPAGTPN
jgi:SAM-dependent methyltransferase